MLPELLPPAAILLVEDEAIVAQDLQQTLTDLGYDPYAIAASADEAMTCAEAKRPDLVLMDIRIKGQSDGIKTAAVLKQRFNCAVIYLTAHADDATVQRAKRTEPYGYLLKPVKTAELRSMIEIALYRRELDAAREKAAQLESKLAERALELSTSNSKLKALIDLSLDLASERDPRVLLEKVCRGARQIGGARHAVLMVTEKLTNSLFCACSGVDSAAGTKLPLPWLDVGPLGRVYAQTVGWRMHTPPGEKRIPVFPDGYPVAAAYLAVPIVSRTRTYGWLCLAEKLGAEEFSAEEERVLGILAGQAGRIYENGSLYADLQLHSAQLQVEMAERERYAADLRLSEERFRQIAENVQDVFFILSADFRDMSYRSPAFEQIWGRPYDASKPMDWASSVHPEDRPRIVDALTRLAAKPVQQELEFRIIQPGGAVRGILVRLFPLHVEPGQTQRVVGVATDITERKEAEAKIRHLNRVYSVLSGISALIVRSGDQAELFAESCRLAVEQGDFRLAWIGWLRADEDEVWPLAWAGDGVVDRSLQDGLPVCLDAEALGTLRRGEPWICNDLGAADARSAHERAMLAHGLRSLVTLPLMLHGQTVGCIVLGTERVAAFDEAEIRLMVELAGDISFALDYLEKADRLNYLAYYDSLTGLANRTLFLERLAQQVSAAKRTGGQFAVVVRDPERFETINETFGRDEGDALLKMLAERLIASTGDRDAVARIGPGQFATMLPFSGEADAAARVLEEQYRAWLGTPFSVRGTEVSLSASAGIAIFPHDGSEPETLLGNAEVALKRAAPEQRTVFFTREIGERVSERLSMETRLRRALQNEEFVLHYQPKVDIETRRLTGLEALIRWQSPELGLVPPVKFIPLMEESGMIVEVGAWVLLRACMDRQSWLERELAAPRVAVNLSSVQLRRPDFIDTVRSALKRATRNAVMSGGGGAGMDLEATESLFIEHVEANMAKLREVRALGLEIAIDDFGTGYSSLGYLAKMPVDCLKIDRMFTSAMLDDPSVTTLVSTIITLAHALKLEVIAEGVESEEQAKILRLLRCDQMQGFLISKPLPFDEMSAELEERWTHAARPL